MFSSYCSFRCSSILAFAGSFQKKARNDVIRGHNIIAVCGFSRSSYLQRSFSEDVSSENVSTVPGEAAFRRSEQAGERGRPFAMMHEMSNERWTANGSTTPRQKRQGADVYRALADAVQMNSSVNAKIANRGLLFSMLEVRVSPDATKAFVRYACAPGKEKVTQHAIHNALPQWRAFVAKRLQWKRAPLLSFVREDVQTPEDDVIDVLEKWKNTGVVPGGWGDGGKGRARRVPQGEAPTILSSGPPQRHDEEEEAHLDEPDIVASSGASADTANDTDTDTANDTANDTDTDTANENDTDASRPPPPPRRRGRRRRSSTMHEGALLDKAAKVSPDTIQMMEQLISTFSKEDKKK
mmetsp:Transcript_15261/g.38571  ORF Transcript_15261/g.38571 Transcript_15261/m.38571 type:complete len:353 (-) Transcript_15261:99-1157(-)